MNEWKVLSNPVGGKYVYQVYRIRNPKEPMHAGNIQTKGPVFDFKEQAEHYAEGLNAGAAERTDICARLLPVLQRTRGLWDLVSLEYDDERELVTAMFSNGFKKIANVAADSGTAMIVDIIKQIV